MTQTQAQRRVQHLAQETPLDDLEYLTRVLAGQRIAANRERMLSGDESDSYDDDYDDGGSEEETDRPGLWRLLCSPLITVLVGPSQHQFHIHRDLLCRHSLYFHHMLRSDGFSESKENVARLLEDDAMSFAVFAEYLYVEDRCDTGAVYRDFYPENFSESNVKNEADEDGNGFYMSEDEGGNDAENDNEDEEEEQEEEARGEGQEGGEDEEGEEGEAEEEGEEGEEGEEVEEVEEKDADREDENRMAYDNYDFMLQFSCYVLADKLQARGFKRHIMDEIRCHGEVCDPASLTANHVRYAYENTISQNDPLRRFCVMMKCKRMAFEETLVDPEFVALMEDGGPLVKDVMRACWKLTLKRKKQTEKQLQHQKQQMERQIQSRDQRITLLQNDLLQLTVKR